ncbi:RNA 2',3'-cyclic phosphodiesterase [Nocardiopsis alba]|uniref:RNA 2',3'-cyclic phosphodiesterase n=1 Tax=Nocardiopsis alba (strain ATCC BAA-2165 / BE74) TaxID=1205910 RepID=J7LB88_NOCAA|nr:RNA 2',3'-cyclic phosphodiesterase [Nocardiopsis alba]AFR08655.1 2'-5' RNA ligase [Nocardiopsis alba ATCC BAA-2165]
MRSFVALWPSPEVVETLDRAVRHVRRRVPEAKWTRREEWHLTLLFLGEVDGALMPGLLEALDRVLDGYPPLDLSLDGWGVFPLSAPRASVVWAGVTGEHLIGLVDGLREAARSAGVRVESRPFVPHLTLARARPPLVTERILRTLGPPPRAGWRSDRIDLVESRRVGESRYRAVRSWETSGR